MVDKEPSGLQQSRDDYQGLADATVSHVAVVDWVSTLQLVNRDASPVSQQWRLVMVARKPSNFSSPQVQM